ncbi:MAG: hypothetical protein V1913_17800, partial [Fibrobacterota bacterium]
HRQPAPAFITTCIRQNILFRAMDALYQKVLQSASSEKFRIVRLAQHRIGRIMAFREKGRIIAPCMQAVASPSNLDDIERWCLALTSRERQK